MAKRRKWVKKIMKIIVKSCKNDLHGGTNVTTQWKDARNNAKTRRATRKDRSHSASSTSDTHTHTLLWYTWSDLFM